MKKSMLALVLLAALMLNLCACGQAFTVSAAEVEKPAQTEEAASKAEITVSASGTVTLVPDKASASFAVVTEEATSEEAQKKNNEIVNKVMETLKSMGVEEKSIRTTGYDLYPRYDYTPGEKERIIGYTLTTSVTVTDQDLDRVGSVISACIKAGANRVNNVRFLCSGYDEAYLQALTKAMEASKLKADTLAAAAGRTLAEAVTISEGWQDTSARYGRNVSVPMAAEEAAFDSAAVSMQPGETEITANVTVTYRMK